MERGDQWHNRSAADANVDVIRVVQIDYGRFCFAAGLEGWRLAFHCRNGAGGGGLVFDLGRRAAAYFEISDRGKLPWLLLPAASYISCTKLYLATFGQFLANPRRQMPSFWPVYQVSKRRLSHF